ncbi:hypothetical protein [African swine fever virus]|uniref:Uncharacterized protein n=1 Tax=African swine fever virus TaxID=10497 RepID=A0A6G8ETW1_ASF|nr:hypothetical protein AFSV47Ss_0213 [African swine fever virus]QIM06855.1 hypothetical protein [African swine fever virus]QIM07090.1 hypothetical protein [African swine fever virus]QIM07325.1 hypothetical protein [African swine fever virus]QIM07560.1 hypothetical protein [African swine fever virus]
MAYQYRCRSCFKAIWSSCSMRGIRAFKVSIILSRMRLTQSNTLLSSKISYPLIRSLSFKVSERCIRASIYIRPFGGLAPKLLHNLCIDGVLAQSAP